MIGRRYDAEKNVTYLGSMTESYPLNGQIEMLCFNKSYNNISTLNSLVSNFDTINHITNYDELQRTSKNVILYGDEEVVSNTYSYDNKSLSLIEYENIKPLNISNIKRSYTYDSKSRITNITDSIFGNHSYEYDYRGYLVKDENMSYTYDDNGNILTAGNNTYEYDSTIKDKLIKYNGSSILYNSNNPLNITKYNNMEFTYEGRRLKEVEIPFNNDYYYNNKYEYNERGLRIKKIKEKWYYSADDDMTSEVTNYFYEGNNLVTEINPDYRLDFLYDENNRLFGLVYNKTNKYFYVRDILNNILGLVDTNGKLVVKYSCDSFGNILTYSDTSGIGIANKNPFRFKGYYYDTDLEMYYCKSRFYVPKLRRWLNADSFDYLEPENIEGVNLFAYCANDPVNYYDPSGHSFILAMLIGAGIGLVIGLGSQLASDSISNVISNGFDFSEWEMSSWQTYVGAGLGGAIGGALTPFLGPVSTGFITGTLSTAITMGLSNVTETSNYSFGEILATSLLIGSVSGITAGILDNIKIPGVNSGKGSLTAVSKQINTKLVNGSIKNVSIKTIGKMAALNAIYSAPFTAFNGLFTNGLVLSPTY